MQDFVCADAVFVKDANGTYPLGRLCRSDVDGDCAHGSTSCAMVLTAAGAFATEPGGVQAAGIALVVGGVGLALNGALDLDPDAIATQAGEVFGGAEDAAVMLDGGELVGSSEVADVGHLGEPSICLSLIALDKTDYDARRVTTQALFSSF
jgi:hypothetical protein